MRRILLAFGTSVITLLWAVPAGAAPLTISPPTDLSIATPFAPGCGGATEGSVPGSNYNYSNAEVEPWIAASPTNPADVAAFWQQDRWSDGGAHGLVAAVAHDGGVSFTFSTPHFSRCAGGTSANGGDFGRSSDPWVSWAPNGDLWAISLSVDRTTPRNAVLAARMQHGTSTWSEPFTLKFDSSKTGIPLGNNFNDKESITADPTDAPGNKSGTISNQIAVLPDGTLLDGFFQFVKDGGTSFQVIRSTDKGVTWSKRSFQMAPVSPIGERDPEPIRCRPFISGDPLCTLVHSDGVIFDLAVDFSTGPHRGRVYAVWQDHHDNAFGDDLIMLSFSDDGGRTWSTPQQVNQTPGGTFTDQAFEPAVSVNDQGVVAVSYYDFRNDVSGDSRLTTDHWIVHSHDGGATWTEDHLAGPFDMHQAPYARGYFVGDYQGLDSQGSVFRPLFTVPSPGPSDQFPNPNPTDVFTNTGG